MENSSPRTSAVLVQRAKEGDREAYDRLFSHVAERAHLYVRLRLGAGLRARVEPTDVLQEAYLQAHKSFSRFEYTGPEAFSRWFCRITENCIRNLADHHQARKRKPPGEVTHASTILRQIRDEGSGVITKADRRDSRERLARAMGRLERDEREVLLLRHFQDLTVEEIAGRIGRTPSSTGRLLCRATSRLGRILGARFREGS